MKWGWLSWLSAWWFVVPWYAAGIAGAVFVILDERRVNTPLKAAMKWAWPIIIVFFSVIGLALYAYTARAPGIGGMQSDDDKQKAHDAYEENIFRRVNGAVIHCVAGDGIGIMSAMVVARALRMSFWQEFWFEYLVGFLVGWLIFQSKSMRMMIDDTDKAAAMAFRAEFFSMLTVMSGMGAVMTFVTPLAVSAQPRPWTFAFWGFGALGLMVGYAFTYPMNFLMVKVGWKHGMGGMEGAHPFASRGAKTAGVVAMCVLGAAALFVPAWPAEVRGRASVTPRAAPPTLAAAAQREAPPTAWIDALRAGISVDLQRAAQGLDGVEHTQAMIALDAATRAVKVAAAAAPGTPLSGVEDEVVDARRAIHLGSERAAKRHIEHALLLLERTPGAPAPVPRPLSAYGGALLVGHDGDVIGKVVRVTNGPGGGHAVVDLGGVHDVWGFLTLSRGDRVELPASSLVYGPTPAFGAWLVALPAAQGVVADGARSKSPADVRFATIEP